MGYDPEEVQNAALDASCQVWIDDALTKTKTKIYVENRDHGQGAGLTKCPEEPSRQVSLWHFAPRSQDWAFQKSRLITDYCRLCLMGDIENEVHFLFKFKKLEDERKNIPPSLKAIGDQL